MLSRLRPKISPDETQSKDELSRLGCFAPSVVEELTRPQITPVAQAPSPQNHNPATTNLPRFAPHYGHLAGNDRNVGIKRHSKAGVCVARGTGNPVILFFLDEFVTQILSPVRYGPPSHKRRIAFPSFTPQTPMTVLLSVLGASKAKTHSSLSPWLVVAVFRY